MRVSDLYIIKLFAVQGSSWWQRGGHEAVAKAFPTLFREPVEDADSSDASAQDRNTKEQFADIHVSDW